jgi:putative spermidine/putrescine transport system ATP-binding protein
MSFLSVRNLGKDYGSARVVKSMNLEIERGEFVSLLGPSGCGKTTTLQMIAGFTDPTRGQVILDGTDLTDMPPEKRDIGVVFQSYALFPHMTVQDNISFGLEMRKMAKAERRERIDQVLDMVSLTGMGERYPAQLSGGQRQRVAIARSLAIRPRLLLLDEPMSNLDAKLRENMHIELRRIQRKLGITTILVTHDQTEAMTMSDRIALMNDGCIQQLAPPLEVYHNPRTLFVSGFLGRANVFEGTIAHSETQGYQVSSDGLTFAVCLPENHPFCAGTANIMIRPENVSFAGPGMAGKLPGTLSEAVFLGTHWLCEVKTPLGMWFVSIKTLTAQPGETVTLDWQDCDLRIIAEQQ